MRFIFAAVVVNVVIQFTIFFLSLFSELKYYYFLIKSRICWGAREILRPPAALPPSTIDMLFYLVHIRSRCQLRGRTARRGCTTKSKIVLNKFSCKYERNYKKRRAVCSLHPHHHCLDEGITRKLVFTYLLCSFIFHKQT